MSNYDSTPRRTGRIDWTCDDCGRGVFGYSEDDLTFQIDMHGEYCGDPDRGSLGETATVASFIIGGVFTFDETPTVDAALFGDEPKCDHVMPDGTTCDAPAPHCVGGEQYFCDEHEIECPATADGKHFYEQQEDVTGRIVWGCDCGALPPERDPDDF